jgi:hypothetical protein
MSYVRIWLFVVTLFVGTTVGAGAAVTVRTAPTAGLAPGGFAFCGVTNGGAAHTTATVTLMSETNVAATAFVLESETFSLSGKETRFGTPIVTEDPDNRPSWCKCTVADKTKVTCGFIYRNGDNVTVLPAE